MKLTFTAKYTYPPRTLMQKCGYGEFQDRQANKISYVRRLGQRFYPRFHVYIDLLDTGFTINLHLDQKQASYEGCTAHSGEYDSELVEKEMRRIAWTLEEYKA